jgi:aldehyde dehydrogenase (NAD+)/aldehyde dehydrogenase
MSRAAVAHLRPAPAELTVRSPYTGETVGTVRPNGVDDVRRAVAAARSAPRLTPEERAAMLRAAAGTMDARRDELAVLIGREAGICLRDGRREVERARRNLVTAAEEATRIHGEALGIEAGAGRKLALTLREPVGVVGAITPFNRPLNQVVVKVAPALAAGNAVVVKPSERTPLSALAFAALMSESGLPPNLLSIVVGEPNALGPALAGDPGVDMVTFTGSPATGMLVARAAAGKKTTLELGGNDPLIVLDDGDLELAARLVCEQAYASAGQSCRGIKRVIASAPIADELVARIAEGTAALRCGDPLDPETDIGPLIDERAASSVETRCRKAIADGARLIHGGKRTGALHEPTLLDHVPTTTALVVRETFGPVAPVLRVRSDAVAVAVANSTPYGLQAGVVTGDFDRFMQIAGRLEVGAVNFMDGPAFDSPHIPFGGVKRSGHGREGIRFAIAEMTQLKTITLPQPRL